jgi:hypothetical protein
VVSFSPFQDIGTAQPELEQLTALQICYPIKNRTKAQNTNITNFMFENCIKEQTFLLTFDVEQMVDIYVEKDLSERSLLFKINGLVHGREPVFTDGIFYMLKGGKLLNCCMSQINESLHRGL